MPYDDKIQQALASVTSERAERLCNLEAYVDGTQYKGRPSWFDDSVPVLRRAPCVVDQVAEGAIESYLDLVLGEERFPTFGEDVQDLVAPIIEASKYSNAAAEALDSALSMGTACSVQTVENGQLYSRTLAPAWCEPELDPYGKVLRLLERVPAVETYRDTRTGKAEPRVVLYERVIDDQEDTRVKYYVPPNKDPWERLGPPEVTQHGLGWCPVVWYRHRIKGRSGKCIDGRAIHASLLDEIDALNRALSQEHRAAHYTGDPQPVLTGVEENENPCPAPTVWRGASYPNESPAVKHAHAQWIAGAYGAGASEDAIMRGPGTVWRLRSASARAELLTLPAGALDALSKNAEELRGIISSAMAWVQLDQGGKLLSGAGLSAMSGAAMAWLYRKQLSRCGTIRTMFGDNWMIPVLEQLWMLAAAVPVGLTPRPSGPPPKLVLTWPPYFAPNEADRAVIMERVRQDRAAGLLTTAKAVEAMAGVYAIEDVDAYVAELNAEGVDRERDTAETYHAAVEKMAAGKAERMGDWDEGEEDEESE